MQQPFEDWFAITHRPDLREFPEADITLSFSAVSISEAAQQNCSRWADCGRVTNDQVIELTSNPHGKRDAALGLYYDPVMSFFRSSQLAEGPDGIESFPYEKKMVEEGDRVYEWGSTPDGANRALVRRELGRNEAA